MKNKADFILSIILYVLIFLIILIGSVSIYHRVQDKPFSIFGYSFSYVVSGSMEPKLEVGDVILSKELDSYNDLQEGDIITYKSGEGALQGHYITHRIHSIEYENGEISYFKTKGDAVNEVDSENVYPEKIRSIYIRRLSLLSFIVSMLLRIEVLFIFILFPIIIVFIKHIKKFIKLIKE